jgi:hypothetical protein
MTYKIISKNENQNTISVVINEIEHTVLVVCDDSELQSAVTDFVSSIENPKTFNLAPQVDLNAIVQSQATIIESLKARLDAANL